MMAFSTSTAALAFGTLASSVLCPGVGTAEPPVTAGLAGEGVVCEAALARVDTAGTSEAVPEGEAESDERLEAAKTGFARLMAEAAKGETTRGEAGEGGPVSEEAVARVRAFAGCALDAAWAGLSEEDREGYAALGDEKAEVRVEDVVSEAGRTAVSEAFAACVADTEDGEVPAESEPSPAVQPTPEPTVEPTSESEPTPEPVVEPEPVVTPEPSPEPKPEPSVEPSPAPEPSVEPVPVPAVVVVPEVSVPEVVVPEVTVPETVVPEVAVPEVAVPEVAVPEVAVPEVAVPEVVVGPQASVPQSVGPQASVPGVVAERVAPAASVPASVPASVSAVASVPESAETAVRGVALPASVPESVSAVASVPVSSSGVAAAAVGAVSVPASVPSSRVESSASAPYVAESAARRMALEAATPALPRSAAGVAEASLPGEWRAWTLNERPSVPAGKSSVPERAELAETGAGAGWGVVLGSLLVAGGLGVLGARRARFARVNVPAAPGRA